MRPFHAYRRLAIAALLGFAGMDAAPAAAQEPPTLLFLGISKDGRPYQAAERAIKRRIEGLEVKVEQPTEAASPCDGAGCLSAALTTAHVEVGLTGRIRQNDRACLATLWFVGGKDQEKPVEHDIACRPDGKEDLLVANLADGAAEMMNDYLRDKEPPPAESSTDSAPAVRTKQLSAADKKPAWSARKKATASVAGITLALSLAGTIAFSALDGKLAQGDSKVPYPLAPYAGLSAVFAGASTAVIITLFTK